MTDSQSLPIQCLCGRNNLNIKLKNKTFGACHCNMCRTWGGAPALAIEIEPGSLPSEIDGATVFSSSAWGERGFCSTCGTHLFFRLKDKSYANIPLGLIPDLKDFKFESEIFIDRKPNCYSFTENTNKLTEAEFLALLSN